MPDEVTIKGDLRHLQDKVTHVEVTVGQISQKVDHAAIEVAGLRADLKHESKNRQSINDFIVRLDARFTYFADRIDKLEADKADKKDVEFEIKRLNEEVEEIKEGRKKFSETARKIAIPIVIAVLSSIGAYLASKLGISDFIKLP